MSSLFLKAGPSAAGCDKAIWFKQYCGASTQLDYEFEQSDIIQYEQIVLNSYGDKSYVEEKVKEAWGK